VVTPRTVGGRIFTVFYTILGIPLFVIVALGFGYLIGKPIANLIQRLELRYILYRLRINIRSLLLVITLSDLLVFKPFVGVDVNF